MVPRHPSWLQLRSAEFSSFVDLLYAQAACFGDGWTVEDVFDALADADRWDGTAWADLSRMIRLNGVAVCLWCDAAHVLEMLSVLFPREPD